MKAGLTFPSNAWFAGSGGGCFNMAAATESANSGIFWMSSGALTFAYSTVTVASSCCQHSYVYYLKLKGVAK